ncbi:hypothetical protein GCM10018779_09850 [Streptomyces griseocarneus]|nr:hypothetical protein GCM10018779_09850 [Streptomyces griseocarneus]
MRDFWHNVVAGRDCITDVPETTWRIEDHYDPDVLAEDKTYARRGGFLPPVVFDPAEFAMPPSSVDSLHLAQLLSLKVAGEVLKDAGCPEASWYDPARTGVILGVCGQNATSVPLGARLYGPVVRRVALGCGLSERDADEMVRKFKAASPPWTEDSFPGMLANVVAGRIANRFDLGGTNCTVDAACASSLAAVRMAVGELVGQRADLMITGGCDADNSPLTFLCFSKTPALSPSGRIKPFDRSADGTLIGEGIGMLALKRLADAERDGDRVYAVLRGLGASSDGRTNSVYAPCGEGQLTALQRAYQDADLPAESVGLIEAHGTGTAVGDATELGALRKLLGPAPGRNQVAVGSVKSQIGHTKSAAGAAGLIKAALALHHKLLPPTINVDSASEAVGDDGLYLNTRARPWVLDPRRPVRRGGVSAFGFGGVNFHAVLEEHRPSDARARALHRTPRAHLWHAPDADALRALVEEGPPPAVTGAVPAGHARLGILAADASELASLTARAVARLSANPGPESWSLSGRIHYRRRSVPDGTKVAALFAGQGSQYVNMGLDALLALPPVRRAFDEANALWRDEDETLAHVVYPVPGEQDAARRLRRTAYAQPAIGALAMGQYRYLAEVGFSPDGLLGHSCGELTALWAAGSLTDEGCLALTRERGRAMEPPAVEGHDAGAMAAVRMTGERWEEVAGGHPELSLCNVNAPDELVVGGPTPAVEAFVAECAGAGTYAHRLPVAAAFHTPLIGHAVDRFAAAVAEVGVRPPVTPVPANTPGAHYGDDPAANCRTLAEQMVRPVDFAGRVRELYADGFRVFVEFGPKQVLTHLVPRTLGEDAVDAVPTDAGAGGDGAAALKNAALRLAVLGMDIRDINRYDAPEAPPPPAPSPVARLLRGPSFAVEARRPHFEAALSDGYRCTPAVPEPASPHAVPGGANGAARDAAPGGEDRLVRAAAEQLDLHSRYVEGQLDTARKLVDLVSADAREASPDGSVLSRVEAVRDHSVALGRAHVRAQEVMLEFARLGLGAAPGRAEGVGALPARPRAADVDALPSLADDRTDGATARLVETPLPPEAATAEAAVPEPAPDLAHAIDPGSVDVADVERILRELVAEKTGYTVDMVEPGLDIQTDLGVDSLKQVEIAAAAWERYPFLPREEIYRFAQARTVRELAALLMDVTADTGSRQEGDGTPLPVGRAGVTLRPLPEADALVDAYGPRPTALVLDDGSALADALCRALSAEGWSTRRLCLPGGKGGGDDRWNLTDWQEATLREQVGAALASAERLDLCVLPVGRPEDADATAALARDATAVVTRLGHAVLVAKHVVPALKNTLAAGHRAGFMAVTQLDGALGLAGSHGDTAQAFHGGLGGLLKALAAEEPGLFCRALDVAPRLGPAQAAERFLREATDVASVTEVAWDGTSRRTLTVSAEPAPPLLAPGSSPALGADDLLVVTGGARGITAWCLTALAAHRPCGFLLLGRTPLEDLGDPAVRASLEGRAQALEQQREMHATLAALRAAGAEVSYLAVDVGDGAAVREALGPHRERVTGVIHAAGVLADQPLRDKTPQDIARVTGAKLTGLINVLEALPAENLRRLVVFTSVAGVYGNWRQTDYAMANEALNRFACAWQANRPYCRVAALAWGPWHGGMASTEALRLFERIGVTPLGREEGCAYFVEEMTAERAGGTVTVLGPTESYFQPSPLPARDAEVLRDLGTLAGEPVLGDHRIDGLPVLPMTAAVGWCLNVLERSRPGVPVTEVRDFRVHKGLVLDGSQPARARVGLHPRDGRDGEVLVTIHDDGAEMPRPRYEGVFRRATGAAAPARPAPPPPRPAEDGAHSAYADGFLFHGPLLRGLGPVLAEDDRSLTVGARLKDPPLAGGAYSGDRYSPALADLLLQAAALLGRRLCGHRCLPVAVERVELFAPLPDDEPFVIVVEPLVVSPLDITSTVTACTPEGDVLQRWNGLKGIVALPEFAGRAAWPAPRSTAP